MWKLEKTILMFEKVNCIAYCSPNLGFLLSRRSIQIQIFPFTELKPHILTVPIPGTEQNYRHLIMDVCGRDGALKISHWSKVFRKGDKAILCQNKEGCLKGHHNRNSLLYYLQYVQCI